MFEGGRGEIELGSGDTHCFVGLCIRKKEIFKHTHTKRGRGVHKFARAVALEKKKGGGVMLK